jgi:sulfite reductase (NADPH) flavoprotein alpha-component
MNYLSIIFVPSFDKIQNGGVVMICGSLAMMHDVIEELKTICSTKLDHDFEFYQKKGQILTDCY